MLPAEKLAFPKFVYLDQNKWIDVARAHYGRPDGEPFNEALAALRVAIAAKKVIVPISGIHVVETVTPRDPARRKRLAEFMVDLSENTAVLPAMTIRPEEVRQAVCRRLGIVDNLSIRTHLVREGLSHAFGQEIVLGGVADDHREILLRELKSPRTSVALLIDESHQDSAQRAQDEDAALVERLEAIRATHAHLAREERRRMEYSDLLATGPPGEDIRNVVQELGMNVDSFLSRVTSPEELLSGIPTVDVYVNLGLASSDDANRPFHRNDSKDLGFMSLAVPYANVIVAERYWALKAQRSGLAAKYDTIVLSDLRELPTVLRRMGCLPS